MKKMLKNNGLTIVLTLAFLGSLLGMWISGWYQENAELISHGLPPLTLLGYTMDESFLSALFENWESEWLQMSFYVMLTALLFQKGSAESRDPDEASTAEDKLTAKSYPVWLRRSAMGRWIYRYSLGLALAILFLASFVGHLIASSASYNSQATMHHEATRSVIEHFASSQFWFESFQNWQSEFFSTAMLVVLSIFLRFKGSPESKPVSARDSETGA
ncbi:MULTISPECIES: DUF6766 family protein [unclassified Phyllobacterium]|uniref:DUF6766 family protein n=1 Tax=unclassified Phyllobacterium TaxID=2638441 RepID=UPI003012D184